MTTSITISLRELLIIGIVGIANSWFINLVQRKQPFPTGIIDFALRNEKNAKLNSYYIFFIIPLFTGIILGFLSISPFLAGLSSALGMLLCVISVFTNPKLLAPPLQQKLSKARMTYFLLILIYFTASVVGNVLVSILPYIELIKNDAYRTGLITNVTTFFIGTILVFGLNIVLRKNASEFEPSDQMFEKMLYEQEKRLSANIKYIVGDELNAALQEIMSTISENINSDNSQNIQEMVKGEVSKNLSEIAVLMNLAIENEIIRKNRDLISAPKIKNQYSSNKSKYIYTHVNERYGYYGGRTIKTIYPRYFS